MRITLRFIQGTFLLSIGAITAMVAGSLYASIVAESWFFMVASSATEEQLSGKA
jgi:hypothetical protein